MKIKYNKNEKRFGVLTPSYWEATINSDDSDSGLGITICGLKNSRQMDIVPNGRHSRPRIPRGFFITCFNR